MFKLAIVFIFLFTAAAFADIPLTILQTSDLHSHFTSRDSNFGLGGVSRVAAKIKQVKGAHPNVLVLDAGDFTEGNLFFTYNTGESTHRIMESLGYDAIVLGNHDWLIGPQELYKSLENTQFKIPILSSNLDFSQLPSAVNLQKYIKPYIIKEFQGMKVGILGLSTFQLIFDRFFLPVKLVDPLKVAQAYVDQMRKLERN